MNAAIILSLIAVFLINFIFIDKIYTIIEPPSKNHCNSNNNYICREKDVLIYGNKAVCREISCLLMQKDLTSDIFNDIDKLDKSRNYSCMLAVNDDDLENLTACSIASKLMKIKIIFAICNKQYNKNIYEENEITCIDGKSSAPEIVLILLNSKVTRR